MPVGSPEDIQPPESWMYGWRAQESVMLHKYFLVYKYLYLYIMYLLYLYIHRDIFIYFMREKESVCARVGGGAEGEEETES